ncbi:hypothetical protein [Deinococcus aluminii]|uniref:Uncharacterized protein n=1 Tax=Deinococcus aluminii TaxID=1656885 RepID=A0ABP9XHK3_9DEIO
MTFLGYEVGFLFLSLVLWWTRLWLTGLLPPWLLDGLQAALYVLAGFLPWMIAESSTVKRQQVQSAVFIALLGMAVSAALAPFLSGDIDPTGGHDILAFPRCWLASVAPNIALTLAVLYALVVWSARRPDQVALRKTGTGSSPFALAWLAACFYGAGVALWALVDRHALVFSGVYAWPSR